MRIDVGDTPRQDVRLRGAERALERVRLAIDVGLGHVVEIDQRQPTHAAAGAGLDHPRADPAEPDDRDVGRSQTVQALRTVDSRDAAEASIDRFGGQRRRVQDRVDPGRAVSGIGHNREQVIGRRLHGVVEGTVRMIAPPARCDPDAASVSRASEHDASAKPPPDGSMTDLLNKPRDAWGGGSPPAALGDADREASLDRILVDWDRERPVWVFGYGSLIWRPEFEFDCRARGVVHGYHRSLCLWSSIYRGTPERPGLVLGLEPGGSVHGVAFRLPAETAHRSLRALWKRELATGSYSPRWLSARVPGVDGRIAAIGFVMNRTAPGYAGELDRTTLLDVVCSASGSNGSCADYVLFTVQSLAEFQIHDRHLARLAEEVGAKITLPRTPSA